MSARFSWRLWNGTGAEPTELALMRGPFQHGFIWRVRDGGWAFGVKRKEAMLEVSTRQEAQRRMLEHAKFLMTIRQAERASA